MAARGMGIGQEGELGTGLGTLGPGELFMTNWQGEEGASRVNLEVHPAPVREASVLLMNTPPWLEQAPVLKCTPKQRPPGTPRQTGPASKGRDGNGWPGRGERQTATQLGSGVHT